MRLENLMKQIKLGLLSIDNFMENTGDILENGFVEVEFEFHFLNDFFEIKAVYEIKNFYYDLGDYSTPPEMYYDVFFDSFFIKQNEFLPNVIDYLNKNINLKNQKI